MIKQSETKRLLHYAFLVGYAMMLFAIALRNVFHINIPILLFLVIVGVLACIGDENDIIALCIAMMPLSKAFQYKYALLLCVGVYILKFIVIKRVDKFKLNASVYVILTMIFLELMHAGDIAFSFVEYFRSITELIFLASLFMFVKVKDLKFNYIAILLAITTVFMTSLVLIIQMQTNQATLQTIFTGNYFRLGIADIKIENYGLNYNSNELGAICNSAICALIVKTSHSRTHWYDLVLITLLFIFGFFTLSRTFILVFAFVIIYMLLSKKEKASLKFKKIIFVSIGLILFFITIKLLVPGVVDSFIGRFMVEDVTNGRSFLFSFYNDHIFASFKNLFWGIGVQNLKIKIQDMYGPSIEVPHNAYQELVVVWGIWGLILFVTLITYIVFNWHTKQEKKSIELLPLLVLLISISAGQFITGSSQIIELALAYIAMMSKPSIFRRNN